MGLSVIISEGWYKRVQVDEIWAFNYCKQRSVATAKEAPEQAGDIWTWTAIDADTKLVVSWLVGSRDAEAARVFMDDVASRLANRVQLTNDGRALTSWPSGRPSAARSTMPNCEAIWRRARARRPLQSGAMHRREEAPLDRNAR